MHPRGIRHAGRNRVVCADDGSYLRMPFQQRIRQLFAQLVRRSLIRVPYEDGQVGALPDFSGGAQEGFSPGGVPRLSHIADRTVAEPVKVRGDLTVAVR